MRLLLHTCCAPCLIYPAEKLREKGFEVAGFFYNPNIHPFSEYLNRRQAVENFIKSGNIEVIYPQYNPAEFFQEINPVRDTKASSCLPIVSNGVNLKETNGRCPLCWSLRLKITARTAKEKGFSHFSTTLLVSPYQDQGVLKKIGSEIAKKEGVDFYYEDFRPGFREAHNKARREGIYCQRYCGCIYSMKPKLTERK